MSSHSEIDLIRIRVLRWHRDIFHGSKQIKQTESIQMIWAHIISWNSNACDQAFNSVNAQYRSTLYIIVTFCNRTIWTHISLQWSYFWIIARLDCLLAMTNGEIQINIFEFLEIVRDNNYLRLIDLWISFQELTLFMKVNQVRNVLTANFIGNVSVDLSLLVIFR